MDSITKVNNTGKQASPLFLFNGNETPTHEQWIEIVDRFEKYFPFIRVFGFDPDVVYNLYEWRSRYTSNGYLLELTRGYNSDRISLTMVLSILKALNELPEFVTER